jgi:hypothetical protein
MDSNGGLSGTQPSQIPAKISSPHLQTPKILSSSAPAPPQQASQTTAPIVHNGHHGVHGLPVSHAPQHHAHYLPSQRSTVPSTQQNADNVANIQPSPTARQGPFRPVGGFPSPNSRPTEVDAAKVQSSTAVFKAFLTSGNPSIVRRVVRDYWEHCLVGTDYHISFVASTPFLRS